MENWESALDIRRRDGNGVEEESAKNARATGARGEVYPTRSE
jgi:hypothetical protein